MRKKRFWKRLYNGNFICSLVFVIYVPLQHLCIKVKNIKKEKR